MADDPADWSRPRVAAGVLFFDDAGGIMLVKPTYKDGWDIPGGYVNSGETPYQACVREVREELGLHVAPYRLLVADWAPHPNEGDKLLFVFDGGVLGSELHDLVILQTAELAEFRFCSPDETMALLVPRLQRRIAEAIQVARGLTAFAYLENGVPPT